MRKVTIDEIALGAARAAERIIAQEHPGGAVQRQARLQVMFAEFVAHAVRREVRNDRRCIKGRKRP